MIRMIYENAFRILDKCLLFHTRKTEKNKKKLIKVDIKQEILLKECLEKLRNIGELQQGMINWISTSLAL